MTWSNPRVWQDPARENGNILRCTSIVAAGILRGRVRRWLAEKLWELFSVVSFF
jgi:hypothetical protein